MILGPTPGSSGAALTLVSYRCVTLIARSEPAHGSPHLPRLLTEEGKVLVAAEEVRTRLRRKLVEEYGVEEADMLLDHPPGGWGELVTRDWLQLVLDARLAPIEEKLASIDQRLSSTDHKFVSLDSRLAAIESEMRAQTWKLVAAMIGLFGALVAAIKL